MGFYILYAYLAKTLKKQDFSNCSTAEEKLEKFNSFINDTEKINILFAQFIKFCKTVSGNEGFDNSVILKEGLEVIFIKEVLTDSDRAELYGIYDLSVKKPIGDLLIDKKIDEKHLREKTMSLLKNYYGDSIPEKKEIVLSYEKFYKYFYGDGDEQNGLINRLKKLPFSFRDFEPKYQETKEYKSQKIRLMYFLYFLESRYDFSRKERSYSKSSINVSLLFDETTMENADLGLIGLCSINGQITHELKKGVFMGIDSKIAFKIRGEMYDIVSKLQYHYYYFDFTVFSSDELPHDFCKRIYTKITGSDKTRKTSTLHQYKNDVLETFYLKLCENESLGRINDLINIYNEINKINVVKPDDIVISEYIKAKNLGIKNDENSILNLFNDEHLYKQLCLMVFGKTDLSDKEKASFNKAKKHLIAYSKILKQETNQQTHLRLIECASLIYLCLFRKDLKISNIFYRYKTNEAQKSVFNTRKDGYAKVYSARVEIVCWRNLQCLGKTSNIEYYFKTKKKLDELLCWVLGADNRNELKERCLTVDHILKNIFN